MTERFDVLIVGGGAAGVGAAKALWASGCRSVALAEEKPRLGGILRQRLVGGGIHPCNVQKAVHDHTVTLGGMEEPTDNGHAIQQVNEL